METKDKTIEINLDSNGESIARGSAPTTETSDPTSSIFESLKGTRDSLTVGRVFGDAYELDGVTVIPVARVAGGGGGGEGNDDDESHGFGTGFGVAVHPIGIYEVRNGEVQWKPSPDVNRIVKGGQMLAGVISICVASVLLRRSRAS